MGANQSTKAERMFLQYERRLREIVLFSDYRVRLESFKELISVLQLENNALDSEKGFNLPDSKRVSLKNRYQVLIVHSGFILRCIELKTELAKMKAPIYKRDEAPCDKLITTARQEIENLWYGIDIDIKQNLIVSIETELHRLDKEITDQFLNVEVRDSIDLIEKTLEEPHFYSLPHLIMWRDTAQEKIQKIRNFRIQIPQELAQALIQKYESLFKQLKAEILKLRTYPIPEPWCSYCMRQGVTHLIKGEFIFFVHPGIEEDMRPIILSERDILPGGLTRQEYDSRMDRLKGESRVAIRKLKAINPRGTTEQLKWFNSSFAEIVKDVNFTFTEIPLLYRDRRSLEYLVNKNQDDELLKQIYNILLRRIRHFYNNRINIPSFAVNCYTEPIFVAPPKVERNIPIASGVDRGATEGLQLVTPASVVVVNNTVIVPDKYGHLISYYRATDLAALGSNHLETSDAPVSLTIITDSLFVCYTNELVKYSFSWKDECHVELIKFETFILIPQLCCTASNDTNLFVGTLKPTIIHIDPDTLKIQHEYPLFPKRYLYKNKNRHPWLQDMKAGANSIICLFTGCPCPLQEFSVAEDTLGPY